MDHATGAMGSLLLKLGELLKEEYDLQKGIKEDVQYLQRELRSMHAALRKDTIDKFLIRVEGPELDDKPHKLKQLVKKICDLFNKGKARHAIGKEIKGIKASVQEVAARRDRYKKSDGN
uniref:Disease resistance N-terminal domain-containing protein n=1 Tax=Aegilops tauschii TaxID=37682 RepID=M8AY30_AEGTA